MIPSPLFDHTSPPTRTYRPFLHFPQSCNSTFALANSTSRSRSVAAFPMGLNHGAASVVMPSRTLITFSFHVVALMPWMPSATMPYHPFYPPPLHYSMPVRWTPPIFRRSRNEPDASSMILTCGPPNDPYTTSASHQHSLQWCHQ